MLQVRLDRETREALAAWRRQQHSESWSEAVRSAIRAAGMTSLRILERLERIEALLGGEGPAPPGTRRATTRDPEGLPEPDLPPELADLARSMLDTGAV